MGINDRDYMKRGYRPRPRHRGRPSLLARLKFWLWRLFGARG
jgi:hypothetical protein